LKKSGLLPIILMVLVWSGYYLASKYLVNLTGSPYLTGMFLRASALIIYTLIMLITGEFKELFKTKKTWYLLIVIGTLGFLLDLFANIGFKYSSASVGTVLLKLDVLMVNVVTAFILKKRLKALDWFFTLMMLCGVVMVLNINFTTLKFNFYDLFFIMSAAAVTANAFVIKWVQKKYLVNSNVIGYYNNFTVLVLFVISSLLTRDIFETETGLIDPGTFVIIAAGGLIQCLIYVFYYYNLKRFEVWIVKVFLLFIPVVTSIVSVIVFKEKLVFTTIIGMAVVLLGAFGILMTHSRQGELK